MCLLAYLAPRVPVVDVNAPETDIRRSTEMQQVGGFKINRGSKPFLKI